LLVIGLALVVAGVIMIPAQGPGYLVLAVGVAVTAPGGIGLRQQRLRFAISGMCVRRRVAADGLLREPR